METGEKFGVVLIRRGREAFGPLAEPYTIGCTAQLVQVEQGENDRYNLTAVGRERFRILSLDRTTHPYLSAQVETYPFTNEQEGASKMAARRLRPWVKQYMEVLGEASDVQMDTRYLPNEPLALAFLSAFLLQIPAREKQTALEIERVDHLMDYVKQLFRREVSLMREMLARERKNRQGSHLN